ncbi:MAG: hypothetical protein JWN86_905 [Planctomycetota bacterium]|nr:hypothetical protein [Planctomycetota bacterium]
MPRFRFTVRRAMVAVAITSLVLALIAWDLRLQRLSAEYRRTAARMGASEAACRAAEEHWCNSSRTDQLLAEAQVKAAAGFEPLGDVRFKTEALKSTAVKGREIADQKGKLADHFGTMRVKYQSAARYPWRSLAPDPPEPK